MGNIIELQSMSRKNSENVIKRLKGDRFVDTRTGEVKECEKSEKRIDRKNALKKTFKDLRNLINANVVDVTNCQWITLTYAENMMDNSRLYSDCEKFYKRYKYHMKTVYNVTDFEYIAVVEPQGRGAWHIHLLVIFAKKPPFLQNSVLREMWGYGFVKITKLDDVSNVGAYLTAYLGDIPLDDIDALYGVEKPLGSEIGILDDELDAHIKVDEKTGKKYVKGGRLHFYPAGMRIYRCSRGVKRPIVQTMEYEKAKEKVSAGTKTFSSNVRLYDDENNLEMFISTEQYNRLLPRSQGE